MVESPTVIIVRAVWLTIARCKLVNRLDLGGANGGL